MAYLWTDKQGQGFVLISQAACIYILHDGRITDGPTDGPSYEDAKTHFYILRCLVSYVDFPCF